MGSIPTIGVRAGVAQWQSTYTLFRNLSSLCTLTIRAGRRTKRYRTRAGEPTNKRRPAAKRATPYGLRFTESANPSWGLAFLQPLSARLVALKTGGSEVECSQVRLL